MNRFLGESKLYYMPERDDDRFNSCQVIYSQFGLAIYQNDHQARRRFVEWAQNKIAVVPDFHKRILFSDEAHFWLNGYVNKQNCRIWSEANPQVYVETSLHPEKLTVWCALWAGGIIGPYFFKNDEGHNVTVNGDRYRAMITNFFIPELNSHDVQELWFQQDGTTCHTARATIDLWKDTFGDRLISRFGPVNWPPRSCDLTPLDYFLWGYVKVDFPNPLVTDVVAKGRVICVTLAKPGRLINGRNCQVIYSQFGLAIYQNDHQARRRFVEWAQNEIAVVPDFHKRILFSDEAHFWLNGYVNKQNCRIWSEANPQVYVETSLHPEKLTVWCALWAGGIIGPYFFKNDEGHNVTVNGDRYRAMITNFFIPELNSHDVQELWFQQDGTTCHTARATIDLWKDTFGDRLISRFGPVNWPPRSCDLTPLDYFLWGYVKVDFPNPLVTDVVAKGRVICVTLAKPGRLINGRNCQVIYSQFGLAIYQNDHQARRRFVEWAQNEIAVVPDFHKRILFSDEAHFWLNGYVNKQNCRIWSEANPQVYVETSLHPEKLTVWCALWAGGIIGPYFFKNDEGHNVTVNGDRYRAMITNFFIPELNSHDVQELWFQQDGTTCHTARATIDLWKDTFGDRLISRFGPVNWPPRSCDLTPLDYFLWGYVKVDFPNPLVTDVVAKGRVICVTLAKPGRLINGRNDEAHFWLNGYVNKHNCRIWSEANPQVYVETPLHPEKLTVCSLAEIVEVEIEVVSPSIVPSGSFTELKSHCHLYGAQGQRQAYLLPMPRGISWASF
ncbi:uncharacterized protein TNCV_772751 [Trichonephila clavipes]|nr:uncharacterized protein TNCV_772751 [Trichonephila clavipes]